MTLNSLGVSQVQGTFVGSTFVGEVKSAAASDPPPDASRADVVSDARNVRTDVRAR